MGIGITGRTITMTSQELFDTVVAHLRQQNAKSLKCGACAYRGDNGMKCAAGILIPDAEYNPTMEGWNVSINSSIDRLIGEDYVSRNVLLQLQQTHDVYEVEEWEERFANIASQFDLRFTPKV
jgi:hypothetical protein